MLPPQQSGGTASFAFADLYKVALPADAQMWLFIAFGLSFAIKVPMVPLHTWLPDAHVEAPTAGSVILAGVLLKMGTYGFIKLGFPLFPDATRELAPLIMVLAVVSIVVGAGLALVQDDIKKIIAYSSISHLGYVMLGLISLDLLCIQGAIVQMVRHGLTAAGLFLMIGMIYERCHTRDLAAYGGLARALPVYSVAFMVLTLASIGLPTTSGFTGEFLVLMGAFNAADGHDPDSFLTEKGTDEFRNFLNTHVEDFVFFKTRVLMEEAGHDPIRKSVVIRDVVSSIAKIQDTFARSLYIRQCSVMLQIAEEILVSEVNKVIKAEPRKKRDEQRSGEQVPEMSRQEEWITPKPVLSQEMPEFVQNDAWQERSVCSVLINYGHKMMEGDENLSTAAYIIENVREILQYFDSDLCRRILEAVGHELAAGHTPGHNWYLGHEDEEIRTFAVNALSTPYVYADWERKEIFLSDPEDA